MFAYDSRFSTFVRKINDYLLINLLLLIACLPVLTIGAAISAVNHTILQNQIYSKGYVLPTFWRAFRQNLKPSVRIWTINLLLIALFSFDISYFYQQMEAGLAYGQLYILFIVLLIFIVLLTLYTFAYLARFEDDLRDTFRNAGIMMLSHPGQNIKLVLIILVFSVGIYFWPILILAFPVMFFRLSVDIFEKIFSRYRVDENPEN